MQKNTLHWKDKQNAQQVKNQKIAKKERKEKNKMEKQKNEKMPIKTILKQISFEQV